MAKSRVLSTTRNAVLVGRCLLRVRLYVVVDSQFRNLAEEVRLAKGKGQTHKDFQ